MGTVVDPVEIPMALPVAEVVAVPFATNYYFQPV